MTIGFLLNTCEPFYRGGYERRAWAFARELARLGHDVRIYTSCPCDEVIDGVRFIRLAQRRRFFNARGVRNGSADILFALATLRLLTLMKREELDVLDVCATPFLHLPFVALVAKLKRIPVVLTCHEALLVSLPDYVRERGNASGSRSALFVRILTLIYRLGMGLFRNRLAVSQRTAVALESERFPTFATVEYGLEPSVIATTPPQPHQENEPVRLIYCGRLTPIKNVVQVLAVLLRLRGSTKAFRFHIIGDGSERKEMERTVAGARGSDVVTFHGAASDLVKQDLLPRCDIFVLGSPREGFSIATLEAMAQGCTALVVNDPTRPNGVLDFVRHEREGIVVAPGVDPLREGLRRLIENDAERETLRRAAWETAQGYRIDVQATRLLEAYEKVKA